MLEVPHTDYIYSSLASGFGEGNRTEVKNKYFDKNPGPGAYDPKIPNFEPKHNS
jgi:hypothetical protein